MFTIFFGMQFLRMIIILKIFRCTLDTAHYFEFWKKCGDNLANATYAYVCDKRENRPKYIGKTDCEKVLAFADTYYNLLAILGLFKIKKKSKINEK